MATKKKFSPFSVDSLLSQKEDNSKSKVIQQQPQQQQQQQQQQHQGLNNNCGKLENNVIKKEEDERIDVCGDDEEDDDEELLEDEEDEEDAKESRLGAPPPQGHAGSPTLAHPTALHPASPRFPPGLYPGAPPPPGFIPPPPHGDIFFKLNYSSRVPPKNNFVFVFSGLPPWLPQFRSPSLAHHTGSESLAKGEKSGKSRFARQLITLLFCGRETNVVFPPPPVKRSR